jgi:cyclopropane fatty-acyl-phospholipid synthase-like methyltransferase
VKAWFETMDTSLWLPPDEQGEEEARFIRRALRLRKGQSVLDAPCGAGRIAVHLARSGCVVTGIDLREAFIKRARRRFRRSRLSGIFQVADLRDLAVDGVFHGILNWFGSFGYFSEAENLDVLRRYVRALRPGGRLLIDAINRERILRHFVAEQRTENVITRCSWDADAQRVIARRTIDGVDDPRNMSSMRLYTPAQMKRLLSSVGLTVERLCGSHHGDAYTRSSRRMIVVGRKT